MAAGGPRVILIQSRRMGRLVLTQNCYGIPEHTPQEKKKVQMLQTASWHRQFISSAQMYLRIILKKVQKRYTIVESENY
jgi:hypothetical protein